MTRVRTCLVERLRTFQEGNGDDLGLGFPRNSVGLNDVWPYELS